MAVRVPRLWLHVGGAMMWDLLILIAGLSFLVPVVFGVFVKLLMGVWR